MTRLKFYPHADYIGCTAPILCNDRLVSVYLKNNMEYNVVDVKTEKVLLAGYANNLATLKKKAKRALVEMGVVFNEEVRNKGKTERLEFK